MLAIQYQLQLSGRVGGALSWHQSLIPRHAEMQTKCHRLSQNVTQVQQLYDYWNAKKGNCICILEKYEHYIITYMMLSEMIMTLSW